MEISKEKEILVGIYLHLAETTLEENNYGLIFDFNFIQFENRQVGLCSLAFFLYLNKLISRDTLNKLEEFLPINRFYTEKERKENWPKFKELVLKENY